VSAAALPPHSQQKNIYYSDRFLVLHPQKVAQVLKKSNEQTFCYWLMLENLILKLPNYSIQAG